VDLDRERPVRQQERHQVLLLRSVRLSVALVAYRTEPKVLRRCLESLARSVRRASEARAASRADLYLIDNGAPSHPSITQDALSCWPADLGIPRLVQGHGNIGYGSANNLVLANLASDVHIVMNPDVEVDADAIGAVLEAFAKHPEVGLVAPAVFAPDGSRQYLCRRYPSLWVLFLRGFAPRSLAQRWFSGALADYEMRDRLGDRFVSGVPLASGCFMAIRTGLFRKLGGFDPGYFMYFEDYDLSVRASREAAVAYEPAARIVHLGGHASRKGGEHRRWFMRSARRFFSRHGWKVI
jgi:GT2 family glycosyltransferase